MECDRSFWPVLGGAAVFGRRDVVPLADRPAPFLTVLKLKKLFRVARHVQPNATKLAAAQVELWIEVAVVAGLRVSEYRDLAILSRINEKQIGLVAASNQRILEALAYESPDVEWLEAEAIFLHSFQSHVDGETRFGRKIDVGSIGYDVAWKRDTARAKSSNRS